MSDTEVDRTTCEANGCPMLATHNRSTNGEGQWLCFIHAGSESADRLRITHELQRLQWLVDIVRQLRAGEQVSAEQHQSFVLAQRSDLKRQTSEARIAYMVRLENVLLQSCKDSLVQP